MLNNGGGLKKKAEKFGNVKYAQYLCSRKISIAIKIFKVLEMSN